MRFDGNFQQRGKFDASALRKIVEAQSEATWAEASFRQNAYKAHSKTQTIPLVFDEDFRHFDPTRRPKYAEFEPGLIPLIAKISEVFGYQGWVVRCILTQLPSCAAIAAHSDAGFSLHHTHRIHLPIITNAGVMFTVGDETMNMKEGELWEINNTRRHMVENTGPDARVHLILDWAEPITQPQLKMYRMDRMKHLEREKQGLPQEYD